MGWTGFHAVLLQNIYGLMKADCMIG